MSSELLLSYSTLGCPDWSFDYAAQQAAGHGYAALEIRTLDGEVIPFDLSTERRASIKSSLKAHGITVNALGLSTRFSSPDAEERQANLDQLRAYIDLANDLEISLVRTFGGNVAEGYSIDQTIDWVAQSMANVMPAASQAGVTVLLETHDAFCRGQEVGRVLDQVTDSSLGALWDVHHPFRMGESITDTWNYIGSRLKHVHLKDARAKSDGGWQLVLMGEGEVPCRNILELLYDRGYEGYVTAEWEKKWHPEIEGPNVAMPQHAAVIRQWWSEITQAS